MNLFKSLCFSVLGLSMAILPSVHAADVKVTECELSSLKVTITRSTSNSAMKVVFEQNGEIQKNDLVEELKFNRTQVSNDPDLKVILKRTGLEIDNILSATVYITDSNSIGKAGLAVFRTGRGKIVGQAFFATYANYIEVCRN